MTEEEPTMAEIVAGIATSHVPFLAMHPQFEMASEAQRSKIVAGLNRAREIIERARPDAIVIFSTDHFDRCFYDNLPAFLVATGERAEGPVNEWLNLPKVSVKLAADLGQLIVSEGMEHGVDFASSQELPLDHAEVVPLSFITPGWDVPLVPIVVNAFAPPMPSLKRCFDVGVFVRTVIERAPARHRIAVIGTGGLSHWVGPPETGTVNEEFDRWFLDCLVHRRNGDVWERYRHAEDLEKVAGNGGQEIRDWLAVAGAMPLQLKPQVLAYEPIPQWATGTGVMAWTAD
jgi:aromatic ring-opening dioxygenase catalytic subunit (LigB family)